MRGLSPVVAVVILIAFAVAIGGLVSLWLTGFTQSTTEFTSEQGQKLTECAGVRLKVDSVTANGIIYSNPSVQQITNITVFDQNGGNLTFNASNLNAGQVTNITWARAQNESIFLRGICSGAIVVEGACESGQVCWE